MNPKVDFYFIKAKKWQEEIEKLRNFLRKEQAQSQLKHVHLKCVKRFVVCAICNSKMPAHTHH